MSDRDRRDLALTAKIEAIHRRSRGVYGSPNIHAELADDYEIRVGRKARRPADVRCRLAGRHAATVRSDDAAGFAGAACGGSHGAAVLHRRS